MLFVELRISLVLSSKKDEGAGEGQFEPFPRSLVFPKIYLLKRRWNPIFLWLLIWSKSHLSWKFHWNLSSCSVDFKTFSVTLTPPLPSEKTILKKPSPIRVNMFSSFGHCPTWLFLSVKNVLIFKILLPFRKKQKSIWNLH